MDSIHIETLSGAEVLKLDAVNEVSFRPGSNPVAELWDLLVPTIYCYYTQPADLFSSVSRRKVLNAGFVGAILGKVETSYSFYLKVVGTDFQVVSLDYHSISRLPQFVEAIKLQERFVIKP
jgi:hypothetical protein